MQNARQFAHLDHEGTRAAGQIVRRADAGVDAVVDAHLSAACGDEAANLCHHRQQRCLAQICAFTAHIGAGQQCEAARVGEFQVVRHEARALRQRQLDNWMASLGDQRITGLGQRGFDVTSITGDLGEARQHV